MNSLLFFCIFKNEFMVYIACIEYYVIIVILLHVLRSSLLKNEIAPRSFILRKGQHFNSTVMMEWNKLFCYAGDSYQGSIFTRFLTRWCTRVEKGEEHYIKNIAVHCIEDELFFVNKRKLSNLSFVFFSHNYGDITC